MRSHARPVAAQLCGKCAQLGPGVGIRLREATRAQRSRSSWVTPRVGRGNRTASAREAERGHAARVVAKRRHAQDVAVAVESPLHLWPSGIVVVGLRFLCTTVDRFAPGERRLGLGDRHQFFHAPNSKRHFSMG